jgi:delta-1-pyrroline-5-carboxylate dehydrogenase (EC 1.5.1.12)
MDLPPFRNEPYTDFNDPANIAAMEQALAHVRAQFGRTYPLIIDGERIATSETIASVNPARPAEVVGYAASADVALAQRAIETAHRRFAEWRRAPVERRVDLLLKAAAAMRARRFELNAWIVYEVSKSWSEADADVAEAIDFCEFYAREMLRLSEPQPLYPIPGEDDPADVYSRSVQAWRSRHGISRLPLWLVW